jgi:hypothetical protein
LFCHCGQVGRWREILAELWTTADQAGLLSEVERMHINTVARGGRLKKFGPPLDGDPRVLWMSEADHNADAWEIATLERLPGLVKADDFVCYIHTKGTLHPLEPGYQEWRRYMAWGVLERWHDCVSALEAGATSAGVELCLAPWRDLVRAPFWAGNFWWARGEYLLSLDPALLDKRNRWSAEGWIGSGAGFKPACLHSIGKANDPNMARNGILRAGFGRAVYAGMG